MRASILMATAGRPGWDCKLPSLLNQSVPADEFIIVFDRTTKSSEKQRLRRQWPAATFLFNEENMGLTKSLNRGLEKASGDYIFRADDDDEYHPDRIEKQLACAAKTNADFIASWALGQAAEPARFKGQDRYLIACPADDDGIKAGLMKRNILIHPSMAIKRCALEALGGYDETFVFAQDYVLYLAAVRAGFSFAAVPEPLLVRSYSRESITTRFRYRQLMYSCAAQIVHHAATGHRGAFVRSLARYAMLAATPKWVRQRRRNLFSILGRGV